MKKISDMSKSEYNKYIKDWYHQHKGYATLQTVKNRFGGNRERVLERDNWTCQFCGMNNEQHILLFGRSLTIDHIDGNGRYSQIKNNNMNNLITLCLRCHGRKDNLRHPNQLNKQKEVKQNG